ncbi:DUF1990 family protein [Glutamicibacter ectropisis]|uniref:DUF1990 family protein n=1 Tax=Glutamicibacter ectropisis TaxID=3046593 RepID=A0AAU6W9V8_9MICC
MSLTKIRQTHWAPTTSQFRVWKRRHYLGSGDAFWGEAAESLLRWEIKTRSGFSVTPADPVQIGTRPRLNARLGPIIIDEPIEVVDTVRSATRVGYAYATRSGHPVRGEEAFILVRSSQHVFLEIRSLTAPSDHIGWRILYPLLLVAQKITRWRYGKALAEKHS